MKKRYLKRPESSLLASTHTRGEGREKRQELPHSLTRSQAPGTGERCQARGKHCCRGSRSSSGLLVQEPPGYKGRSEGRARRESSKASVSHGHRCCTPNAREGSPGTRRYLQGHGPLGWQEAQGPNPSPYARAGQKDHSSPSTSLPQDAVSQGTFCPSVPERASRHRA